jgi:hypothetical protein
MIRINGFLATIYEFSALKFVVEKKILFIIL